MATNGKEVARVEQSAADLAGWEGSGVQVSDREAGAVAMIAREDTELKAAIVVAKRFPRDEAVSYNRVMKSVGRPSMAEKARYSFPRGGTRVEGPSVKLTREVSRCWGNIRSGIRIVSVDDDQVHIRGYALDLETNAYAEMEDRFARLIQRKKNGRTEWVEPDERDLRELINRRGAICERNAQLKILPPDVVEDAMRKAAATLAAAAKGELEQNRDDAIRRIVVAFDGYGVTGGMVAEYLGHELSLITPDELADLRAVYSSIEEGNTKPSDHFAFGAGAGRRAQEEADLNARLEEAEKEVREKAEARKKAADSDAAGDLTKLTEES